MSLTTLIDHLRFLLGEPNIISSGDSLESLSKDYYWYSPILKPQLDPKRADVVIRPGALQELRAAVAACYEVGVAVTVRGGGTGNYGQCVPLHGGVVVDLTRMDRVLSVEGGVLRAEPGARLGAIETVARASGWELRCYPSTWMKATIGGFLAGGAGGIGGVRWGGIAAGDTVKAITLLTCQAEPRLVRLEGADAFVGMRTYGTTGLLVEVEMRLAPALPYDQIAVSSPDWDRLLDWTDAAARNGRWRKRVVSQFQWPIPGYFKPLKKHLREGEHASFLMPESSETEEMMASAKAAGLQCVYNRPLSDPPKPPFLSDFTYNHTTLWAMKSEPAITYLQAGFTSEFREQFKRLFARFPGEILLHLEWGANDPSRALGGSSVGDAIGLGGIPLIFFKSEQRLREIIGYAREIGVGIGNTHSWLLPETDPAMTVARFAFKRSVDPKGLMNPGKLNGYPVNPFVEAAGGRE